MEIIDQKLREQLAGKFSKELKGEVRIWLFTSKKKESCEYCDTVTKIVNEICSINDKLMLFVYDIDDHQKEAKVLGVEMAPAILLQGAIASHIYYYGMPTGYEFSSLVEDLIDISQSKSRLSNAAKEIIKKIDKKIEIKVFVTPTCPYCPAAVRMAHQAALENTNIKASMIEAMEFSELSGRYGVMGVPKIVINDHISFEGAVPEETFISYVKQAAE